MAIKDNIRKLRIEHGMTQQDLAEIAGVTDRAVSTWEVGKKEPRLGAIQKMADYFHIKKSNIIEEDGLSPVRMHTSRPIPVYAEYCGAESIAIDCVDVDARFYDGCELIAVRVPDNSMMPIMREGDVAIFQQGLYSATSLVSVGGNPAIIRVVSHSDTGQMILAPADVASIPYIPPVVFSAKECLSLPVTVIGGLAELQRRFGRMK